MKGRDLNIRTDVKVRAGEGVGVIEAPRGLLIHHYRLNEQGIITYANVITPTVMFSKHVEVATKSLSKKLLEEGVSLTEVEAKVGALVRAYDPCLVCAVHLEVRR
ncbi:MAG: nickel-dependent hydrogenase large subunit [Sulfolobales archaeon]